MKKPIPFGKYHLLERINVGGMAEVFRAKAYGVEGFERIVAVKRILPNIAEDEEFISMFIDEAKIAVQLNHANIAQIFDLGMVDGAHFIALEHVWGRDLRSIFDRCRQRGEPMPVAQACFAIMKLCEGLDYAHNKKDASGQDISLVHRDVSPQNVLVSFEGEVKVIDFGIAKAAGRGGKTQAGILKGKFGYMSPEQVRGLPIDRRSDIFSTGIVLYELLTNERLFIGESDFSTLEKVRNVEILPPTTYNRKIPEELERIVLKALAKDVEDRYQHSIDFHDELQAFVYTAGEFYSRKDLTGWMKKFFAKEIEDEAAKMEEFRKIGPPEQPRQPLPPMGRRTAPIAAVPPPPPFPPLPSGNGRGPAPSAPRPVGRELEREAAEHETQIFDSSPGEAVMTEPVVPPIARPAREAPLPRATGSDAHPASQAFEASPQELAIGTSGEVDSRSFHAINDGEVPTIESKRRSLVAWAAMSGLVVLGAGVLVFSVGKKPAVNSKAEKPISASVEFPQPETTGDLSGTGFDLFTDPVGARVFMDDKHALGEAPKHVVKIAPGKHVLSVEAPPGFVAKTQEILVEEGKIIVVRIRLDALPVEARFRSEPSGAKVTLETDGVSHVLRAAPQSARLDPRKTYEVTFEKDGYVTRSRSLVFRGEPELRVVEALEKIVRSHNRGQEPRETSETRARTSSVTQPPAPPEPERRHEEPKVEAPAKGAGFLDINSKPPCKIFIDGKDTSLSTPRRGLSLPAGTHRITLINNEFGIRESYTLVIKTGEATKAIYDYSEQLRR